MSKLSVEEKEDLLVVIHNGIASLDTKFNHFVSNQLVVLAIIGTLLTGVFTAGFMRIRENEALIENACEDVRENKNALGVVISICNDKGESVILDDLNNKFNPRSGKSKK